MFGFNGFVWMFDTNEILVTSLANSRSEPGDFIVERSFSYMNSKPLGRNNSN